LRQNDFGGTLGGPLKLAHVGESRDKTFFFFSYEGLRLVQPQAATVTYVPDSALRQAAPSPLRQALNTFPVANGPDLGTGIAEFRGSWSNPSSIDSASIRLDHALADKGKVFFRFSNTSSSITVRSGGFLGVPSNPSSSSFVTRSYTVGATNLLSNRLTNDIRANYSSNEATLSQQLDSFGGAQPSSFAKTQGIDVTNTPAYNVSLAL
jgi:hypothetical protein